MFPLDAYVVATNPSTGEFSLSLLDRFRVTIGNNTASFALRTGREGVLRSDVSVAGRGLVGHLTYTHTLFSQPPTGSAAATWEPDTALSIGAVRLTSAGRPFALLRLALTDLPSQASAGWTGVGLDIVSTGGLRVSATTFGEARLWPGGYAQAGATLGYSLGDLPTTLRFSFSDLRAVALPPAAVRVGIARAGGRQRFGRAVQLAESGHGRRGASTAVRSRRRRLDNPRWIRYNVRRPGGWYRADRRSVHVGRPAVVRRSRRGRHTASRGRKNGRLRRHLALAIAEESDHEGSRTLAVGLRRSSSAKRPRSRGSPIG